MLHDFDMFPDENRGGEVISIAKTLDDAWRSVFAFSLTGQLPPDRPLRPHQVGRFLTHPTPDLSMPGASDYYAILVELGVIEAAGRKIWPGEHPEYGFPEGAHVIHERLNMTMQHLSDIADGFPRDHFSDEELEETMMVLQTVEAKYQGDRAELPFYFDNIGSRVPSTAMVTYE